MNGNDAQVDIMDEDGPVDIDSGPVHGPAGKPVMPSDMKRNEEDIVQSVEKSTHITRVPPPQGIPGNPEPQKPAVIVDTYQEEPPTDLIYDKAHDMYVSKCGILRASTTVAKLGTVFPQAILDPLGSVVQYKDRFELFYQDSPTIAFNRNGTLFFNLRIYECRNGARLAPLHDWQSDVGRDMRLYWFQVLPHELAHNVVEGHGHAHENAMSIIFRKYFWKLAKGGLGWW